MTAHEQLKEVDSKIKKLMNKYAGLMANVTIETMIHINGVALKAEQQGEDLPADMDTLKQESGMDSKAIEGARQEMEAVQSEFQSILQSLQSQ